jgi:predicted nucleotidyltransferase
MYGRADQAFYLRQLDRELGVGYGALQRELKQLSEMGLIVRNAQGNQVLYRANLQSPIFAELKSLVAKTVGIRETLVSALTALRSKIKVAFIYGSVARQQESANSDVDLMVVGSVSFSDVVSALGPAQKAAGREINPAVFPVSEFRAKLADGNHFLSAVVNEEKIFVIGTRHDLAKLVAKWLADSAHGSSTGDRRPASNRGPGPGGLQG